jgi:tetratricopeptide (TPR) repeat protein
MDNSKPISIQNVNGNVTVTIIEGNNNKTELNIDGFTKRFAQDCGLRLIYNDYFKQDNNTSTNFQEWLKGFQFNIKSIYHGREFRRETLINSIKEKLEDSQRLLLLGESGTSKTILLMEILCDYLKKGYKILHNLDFSISTSGEITNLEYIENTLLGLIKNEKNVIVIVDGIHNKTISNIFSLIQKIKNDHEDKLDKINFLLSARQPEFDWAMDRGIFDSQTIERIDIFFEDEKRYNIPYFTEDEVKGFLEKYKEHLHPSKRNKSIEEIAYEVFTDTKGYPIMVRFSLIQDGLKSHVVQMYTDYLVQNVHGNISPNIERIKSVIACSLYDISSIPLTEDELYNKLDLKKPSLQLSNTIIKKDINGFWTTIHPRWDLELFKYMFSLNEVDRRSIQKAFNSILTKILEIQRGTLNQLIILNALYKTVIAERFIDIKIIQEMIKIDDIEKKLDNPFFKISFFANIIGVVFANLKHHEYAIICYDKAIEIDSQYVDAHYNKGIALSAIGKKEDAILCYNKAIELDPRYVSAYYSKGNALSAIGKKEDAILCYNKAIELDPTYLRAYNNKGNILSTLGRNKDALDCFARVLKNDPENLNGLLGRAYLLVQMNKISEAKSLINRILFLYPDNKFALDLVKSIE